VSRIRGGELPRAVIQTVFKADVGTLPAYTGSQIDGDYVVYKIVKVNPLEKVDEAQRKALQTEYGAIVAQEELAAYLTALRARYKININTSLLESRDRQ
jgi:peptidyl-prolyl cis-trans isomerase D